jgi:hypothetical protein
MLSFKGKNLFLQLLSTSTTPHIRHYIKHKQSRHTLEIKGRMLAAFGIRTLFTHNIHHARLFVLAAIQARIPGVDEAWNLLTARPLAAFFDHVNHPLFLVFTAELASDVPRVIEAGLFHTTWLGAFRRVYVDHNTEHHCVLES